MNPSKEKAQAPVYSFYFRLPQTVKVVRCYPLRNHPNQSHQGALFSSVLAMILPSSSPAVRECSNRRPWVTDQLARPAVRPVSRVVIGPTKRVRLEGPTKMAPLVSTVC